MSCSSCQTSACACRAPIGVIPPQVRIIKETIEESGCSIKGWYELLGTESFVPQDVGETQVVTVCDSTQYLPGTCVLFIDAAGHTQVQRVIARSSDTSITVEAYANAYSDENTTLSGSIYASPLALCPAATVAQADECQRVYYVTADAFTMPATLEDDGSAVEVCFDDTYGQVSLPLGATVYVEGAGYMEVSTNGEFSACANCHYLVNTGASGNAAGGVNIPAGAHVFLAPSVSDAFAPTNGDIVKSATYKVAATSSTLASGTFVNDWVSDIRISWKVGLAPDSDVIGVSGGVVYIASSEEKTPNKNYHWGIKVDNVWKSDETNDAEGTHWMGSTSRGEIVLTDQPAGSYAIAIVYDTGTNSNVPTVDCSSIIVQAFRKQASVS